MIDKRLLTVVACGLLAGGYAQAQNYPYLDDANRQADAPVFSGNFPKIMATETQSDDASNEAWSKYDLLGTKTGMMYRVAAAQAVNPELEFHFSFHPGEYLGYLSSDPCDLAFGMPFNATAAATSGCSVYAGHWLYRAGTRLTAATSSTATTIYVQNAGRLQPGSFAVIYDSPAGSFNNAEHVQIAAIDRSVTPHRVTLAQRGYKSTPRYHAANSIIAVHVQGSGGSVKNWAYNIGTTGKRDANNRTIAQVMVNWIPNNMNRNAKGQTMNVRVDGIYFDQDNYYLTDDQADVNNDLVADGGVLADGTNAFGDGLENFYQLLRNRLPGKRIIGGWRQTRGFPSLNGVQMENWLLASGPGNEFATNPQYIGPQGIYSQLHNYTIHMNHHDTATGYTEALSKVPTKLYPGTVKSGPNPVVPATNANFRLGFGAALLGNGHYGRQNSNIHPDPWYDEYAVDVQPGSPNFGHAIASNRQDESAIRAHKGWLGKPLGERRRIYNAEAFKPEANMLSNGSFESGTDGWMMLNVNTTLDTADKVAGNRSLRVFGHTNYAADVGGASLRGPTIDLIAGRQYTLVFSAKASKMREIFLRLDWSRNQGNYLVPDRWTKFVYTITAESSGTFRPIIELGREDTQFWIDEVYVFEGDPNVFRRDFENGIVVVNATPKYRTVGLGGTFQRIKGTGQDPVNNGQSLNAVTLPPFDAAILVRPEQADPVEPPPVTSPPVTSPPSDEPINGGGTISIGGRAWQDADNDGIREDSEAPFAGLTVELRNCLGYAFAETTTDSTGRYQFDNLGAGGYTIYVDPPSGSKLSPPLIGAGNRNSDIIPELGDISYCMRLDEGGIDPLAVGIGLAGTGGIGDDLAKLGNYVWADIDRDGIQDADEPGMTGVTVKLASCNNSNVFATKVSKDDGHFEFIVNPGSYRLLFETPLHLELSPNIRGASRAVDSNPDPATGYTSCISIEPGKANNWIDAGFRLDLNP